MSMLKCPVWGTENKASSKGFCSECGMPLGLKRGIAGIAGITGNGSDEGRMKKKYQRLLGKSQDRKPLPGSEVDRKLLWEKRDLKPLQEAKQDGKPSSGSEAGWEPLQEVKGGNPEGTGRKLTVLGFCKNHLKIGEMDGRIRNYRWTTLEKKKISEEKSAQAEVAAIHRLAILSL